jgi:hypothetical protein
MALREERSVCGADTKDCKPRLCQASRSTELRYAYEIRSVRRTRAHARGAPDDMVVWMPVANISNAA